MIKWIVVMNEWLKQISLKILSFLRLFEPLAIIIAVFALLFQIYQLREQSHEWQQEKMARQEERIARAWQLLTTRAPGNSGKVQALEFLAKNDVPLVNLDLSCSTNGGKWDTNNKSCSGGVYLDGLDL